MKQHELTPSLPSRRRFVKTVVIGGVAWSALGPLTSRNDGNEAPRVGRVLVDYGKCTGCRTCETVCAQHNHQVEVGGERLWGLGNPSLANIRVAHFNPDVDVPVVCAMCEDSPCIEACPVNPDDQGRRALYRDPKTMAVKSDPARCLGCGLCARACREKRVGAIIPNRDSGRPERMCTLCDGDPQCVKYCPYGALSYHVGALPDNEEPASAEAIARKLMGRWYGARDGKVEEQP